ncbi:MAG: hypothetical protein WDW36_002839 [Sanguina aurantia]
MAGRDRLCIVIGAGVSGLQAARSMLTAGVEVQVLEQQQDVGGIWLKRANSYGCAATWAGVSLPDFPAPADADPSATAPGPEIVNYLRSYAQHFRLLGRIRFGSRVLQLRQQLDYKWCISYTHDGGTLTLVADFLIMACGAYFTPVVPAVEGRRTFPGKALHVRDFPGPQSAHSLDVIVVGSGKEAQDCAVALADSGLAHSVTAVFKQAHWPIPPSKFGTPLDNLTNTGHPLHDRLPPYYTARRAQRLLRGVRNACNLASRRWWGLLKQQLHTRFLLFKHLDPEARLLFDMFADKGQVEDPRFAVLVQRGAIRGVRGSIARLDTTHAVLKNGNPLPAQLVVFCTGYASTYDMFDAYTQEQLSPQRDGLYLYRNMVCPLVRNLAFIGSEACTGTPALTASLQCSWLLAMFNGSLKLPPLAEMQADVSEQARWKRKFMPLGPHRGATILWYAADYHSQLRADLAGINASHSTQRVTMAPICFAPAAAAAASQLGWGRAAAAAAAKATTLTSLFIHVPSVHAGAMLGSGHSYGISPSAHSFQPGSGPSFQPGSGRSFLSPDSPRLPPHASLTDAPSAAPAHAPHPTARPESPTVPTHPRAPAGLGHPPGHGAFAHSPRRPSGTSRLSGAPPSAHPAGLEGGAGAQPVEPTGQEYSPQRGGRGSITLGSAVSREFSSGGSSTHSSPAAHPPRHSSPFATQKSSLGTSAGTPRRVLHPLSSTGSSILPAGRTFDRAARPLPTRSSAPSARRSESGAQVTTTAAAAAAAAATTTATTWTDPAGAVLPEGSTSTPAAAAAAAGTMHLTRLSLDLTPFQSQASALSVSSFSSHSHMLVTTLSRDPSLVNLSRELSLSTSFSAATSASASAVASQDPLGLNQERVITATNHLSFSRTSPAAATVGLQRSRLSTVLLPLRVDSSPAIFSASHATAALEEGRQQPQVDLAAGLGLQSQQHPHDSGLVFRTSPGLSPSTRASPSLRRPLDFLESETGEPGGWGEGERATPTLHLSSSARQSAAGPAI